MSQAGFRELGVVWALGVDHSINDTLLHNRPREKMAKQFNRGSGASPAQWAARAE